MAIQLSGVQLGNIGGGPSSLTLEDLADVLIVTPQTGQYLRYNAGISEWQNAFINSDVYSYLNTNLTSSNGVNLVKTPGPNTIDITLALSASGDATGNVSGGVLPLTLANVNANVGTFGSASQIPVFTTNAKGLITGVTTVSFSGTSPLATSLAGGSVGALPYQSASSVTSFLTAGTSSQVLISGTTPSWTNAPTLSGANFSSIPNSALVGTGQITVGSTAISLGDTVTTIAGLTSVTSTTFVGALTGTATNSTNAAITDDVASAPANFITMVSTASGNRPIKTSSTKLYFVPSTGILTSTAFAGSGAGLTNIPNSALTGSGAVTIGSTSVALGDTATTIAGLTSLTSTSFTGALTGNASTATLATTATNVGGGTTGAVPYQTAVSTTALLAAGTSSQVLVSGTTPSWSNTPTLTGTNFTSIPNGALSNSSVTVGSTAIALGATTTTLAGLTSVTSTSFTGALTGAASANVLKAGDTMTGLLILSGDPVNALGAVTKQYADGISSGVNVHAACATITTAPLAACTYNNGTGGVGATLTCNTNIVLGTIGGYAGLVVTSRVLVKDQVSGLQNGIYEVSSLGVVGVSPWILTRAADFDGSPTSEVVSGDLTYIQSGSNAGSQWVQTANGTGVPGPYIIIGTDVLVFGQFAGSGTYTAGTGIDITTGIISNTGVLSNIAGTNISVSGATGNVTISVTGTVPSATSATTATNIAGGAAGSINYQTAASTTALLAAGTSSQVLVSGTTPGWTNTPTLTGTNFTGVGNGALTNSSVTFGSTSVSLGGSSASIAGLTSVTATTFTGALVGNASTATSSTNATNTAVTDDTTTNATKYISWVDATSGNNPIKVSSTKLTINPSTGVLTAIQFSGSGAGLTSIPNSALTNSSVTVGSTSIALGDSATSLAGLTSVTSTSFIGALTGNASTATSSTTATNLAAGAAGSLPYQSASGTTTMLTAGTNGFVLTLAAGVPTWAASTGGVTSITGTANQITASASTGAVTLSLPATITGLTSVSSTGFTGALTGNATTATTATNIAAGAAGSIPYQTAASTTSLLAAGTNGFVLTLSGGLPTWAANGSTTTFVEQSTTATASQTTFSVTGGYLAGLISVYYNGLLLTNGVDYTASNGTTFVLTTGATVGAELVSRAFTGLSIANALPLTGGTLTGALTATSFTGSGAGLTNIPNGALTNSKVTIGSTDVALGATVTTFAGLTTLTASGTITAGTFNATSTKRVKKAIKNLGKSYLTKFADLKPREYDRKDYVAHEFGFVAEEMALVYPEIVGIDSGGQPNGIDYGKLSAILTAKVQEQQTTIDKLQSQMTKVMEMLKGLK